MHEYTTRRRIEFADTDMGGIVHFSRFFVFMETTEHEFLRALGTSVDAQHEGRRVGWPRVAASCTYDSPARYGDVLEIRLRVARKGRSSMTYDFLFGVAGRQLARGRMTSVCCEMSPDREVRSIPIPEEIASQIDEAPE